MADSRLPASIAALRRVLAVPRLVGVEAAFLAFNAAEYGTWVAVLVYAYLATGPESVGPVAVAQLVPAALVAPFTSAIGDRYARDRALALSYVLLAIAMTATGVAMISGAAPLVVYALAVVASASLTTVRPLQAAILPALVGKAEQLTAANALSTILDGVGGLIGPAAAGLLMAAGSPGTVFVAGGLLSALGAALVAGIHAGRPDVPARDAPGGWTKGETAGRPASGADRPSASVLRAGVLDGLRDLAGDRGGLLVVLVIGVRYTVVGAIDVLLVLAAIELLGLGEGGAGYLGAALGLGVILGGATTLALVGRLRLAPYLLVGSVAWALAVAAIALVPPPLAALGLLAVAGIGLAVVDVAARTLLQRLVPAALIARVFGVVEAFTMGGLALGALLATALVPTLGVGGALVVAGLLLPAATVATLGTVVAREARITIPLHEIAHLRRLPLFAPLPAPAVESAARALTRHSLPAGSAIVREGDPGDRFYVIEIGRVRVSRGTTELRTLGPGDGFGEIALIRRVARTATVTAATDVELLGLERDAFLIAVTGTPRALDEADRVVDAYLAGDAGRGGASPAGAGATAPGPGRGADEEDEA